MLAPLPCIFGSIYDVPFSEYALIVTPHTALSSPGKCVIDMVEALLRTSFCFLSLLQVLLNGSFL